MGLFYTIVVLVNLHQVLNIQLMRDMLIIMVARITCISSLLLDLR